MEGYREGGSFTHNGETFSLDCVLERVEKRAVGYYAVSKLSWLLEEMPVGYFVDPVERSRIERADTNVPVIVTDYGNLLVVIDGVHRLKKAVDLKMTLLPGRYISSEQLQECRMY
jgi:hypothetical protein